MKRPKWLTRGPLALYRAKTQYENFGDLLINGLMLDQITKRSTVLIDWADSPIQYQSEIKKLFEQSETGSLSTASIMIIGIIRKLLGLPNTFYIVIPGHRYNRSPAGAALKLLRICALAGIRASFIQIVQLGVSVGPFTPTFQLLERLRSTLIEPYTVRESLSLNFAKKIGIKKAQLFPDFSLLLPENKTVLELNENQKRRLVLISFRDLDSKEGAHDRDFLKLIDLLKQLVGLASEQGRLVKIFYQVDRDREFCDRITSLLPLANVSFIGNRLDLESTFSLYNQANQVISNRMHVLLTGAMLGACPIGLIDPEKNSKIVGTLTDVKLRKHLFDIRKPLIDSELRGIVDELEKTNQDIIRKAAKEAKILAEDTLARIFENKKSI